MADSIKVLVTGMSGLIGGIVGRHLASLGHEIRALNRQPVEGFETVQADITDYDAIRSAFSGIDTVIHLAAHLGHDDQSEINVNIVGTYNVFKAAGDAGVRRQGARGGATAVLLHPGLLLRDEDPSMDQHEVHEPASCEGIRSHPGDGRGPRP